MEYGVFNIPRPDAVIYLRMPVETSLMLLARDRAKKNNSLKDGKLDTVEEDREYLENSVASAEWLLTTQPGWHAIDCMDGDTLRSMEDIHEEIWKLVSLLR